MSYPIFYVPAGDVLPVFFATYDGATGASEAATGLAVTDIEIYKDGSVTQRASDAGYTLLDTDGLDFDAITGINGFSIDTGDDTDAGFYSVGAWFTVVVSAITADGQTVNFIACQFRIMAAEGVAGVPDANVTHILDDAQSATDLKDFADAGYDPATNKVQGVVLTDTVTTYTGNTPQTGDAFARLGAPAGASVSADIAAIEAQTDDIGVAGAGLTAIPWNAAWDAEVQSEVADALDAAIPATPTADSINERIKTMDDADLPGDVAAVKAETASIQTDTNDIPTRLPAALTAGGNMKADMLAVSGDTTAADTLEALMDGVIVVQVNGVATTTSIPIDGFTSTRNDQFNGRLITILDGSGEQTDITDYVHATASTGTLTVTALSAAPADNTFIVIH